MVLDCRCWVREGESDCRIHLESSVNFVTKNGFGVGVGQNLNGAGIREHGGEVLDTISLVAKGSKEIVEVGRIGTGDFLLNAKLTAQ